MQDLLGREDWRVNYKPLRHVWREEGLKVLIVLDELTAIRGAPKNIRSDNGSEFIADVMKEWCKKSGTNTLYIEPGAPWQNGIVESFNSGLRDELLSSEFFATLAEAQLLCAKWRADYNHRRPRRALGKQTPAEYAVKCEVSAARRLVQRMETPGNTRKAASIMIAETS
jgi:transposase InsO family protein